MNLEVNTGHDIYRNLLKELQEEGGIREEHIKNCPGIGILQSTTTNVLLIGLAELNVTCKKLREIFKARLEDEMQDLVFIEDNNIKTYLSEMPTYKALLPDLL